jgi:Tfp pilus assembly protein PilF
MQVLHRAGLHGQALEAINDYLSVNVEANPFGLAKLARIATDAGGMVLAARLLHRAVDKLDTREALEFACRTADNLDDRDLQDRITARFERLFPGAVELRQWRARALMAAGEHAAASIALTDLPDASETRELLAFLAVALAGVAVPDYVALLRSLSAQNPSRTAQARAFLIEDALRRGLIVHAFELAIPVRPGTTARRHVDLVLRVVTRLLFDRDAQGNLAVDPDRLATAVLEVVRYLSAHSADGAVRLRLTRMLSVEVSGSIGLPLIASVAVNLINRPRSLREKPVIHALSPEELDNRRAFLESAFDWLEAETPIVIGRAVLPTSLLPEDVDEVAAAIPHLLIALGGHFKDDEDVKEILNWLALGTSLAPHTSDPDQDLAMIQLAAGRLGLAGRVQHARDLAEQALQAAGDNPRRQRAAWFVMADVYHRVGNNLESLIALACAAAGASDIDAEQAWQEVNALARLLRDIGLFELARETLGTANDLLHQMGFAEANEHRLETMRIQIDMKELHYRPETLSTALPDLLTRIVANASEVLSRHDDPVPVAVMLGQMIRMAAASEVPVPPKAQERLEALVKHIGPAAASLVRAVSASHPTGADVLIIHQQTERARYSDDVAYDTRNAVMAARSLLSAEETAQDPEVAVFAIELLADRAIAMPGWETTARPAPAITAVSEPAAIAKQISKDGLSIVLAGINDDGHVVQITVAAGELGAVQREDVSVQRIRAWTREFPYRYGIDESTPNLFHISTEGLGVAALPEGRVVLIWDTELQPLPPNLLRIGDAFAGHTRPMAAAPSLSWLAAARSGKAATTDRMAAWISTEETQGSTLAMIADRLGPTFAEHGIHLDTSPAIPEGLVGSEMVIVAAHGGTIPDGNYFQRVSDEGELKVVAAEMANALRNVGVVILFVCSAGRADKHPSGSTIVGLAKQLLDRGCSAVIASPWPLDSRVPYHWLPAFLEAWRRGLPLADANFEANAAVAKGLGDSPAKCLAMTVFGDPLRTVNPSSIKPTKSTRE